MANKTRRNNGRRAFQLRKAEKLRKKLAKYGVLECMDKLEAEGKINFVNGGDERLRAALKDVQMQQIKSPEETEAFMKKVKEMMGNGEGKRDDTKCTGADS